MSAKSACAAYSYLVIKDLDIEPMVKMMLVDRICDDWITTSHRYISDYLHHKGSRVKKTKVLNLPQFVYVCFEEEDAIRISRVFVGMM